MRGLIHCFAAAALAMSGMALSGCDEPANNLPPGENSTTAGGNGAFGESPADPGDYRTHPAPTTQPTTPADLQQGAEGVKPLY